MIFGRPVADPDLQALSNTEVELLDALYTMLLQFCSTERLSLVRPAGGDEWTLQRVELVDGEGVRSVERAVDLMMSYGLIVEIEVKCEHAHNFSTPLVFNEERLQELQGFISLGTPG